MDKDTVVRKEITDKEAHKLLLDMSLHVQNYGDGSETDTELAGVAIRYLVKRLDDIRGVSV